MLKYAKRVFKGCAQSSMSKKKITFISLVSMSSLVILVLIYFATVEGMSYQVATKVAENIQEDELNNWLNDPAILPFISEEEDIADIKLSETNLPIKTRTEAINKVTETFSSKDMKELSVKLQTGLTASDKAELIETVNQHFSEEEIISLKILALQEVKKRNPNDN